MKTSSVHTAIVVGGGPAGASTAIALARNGIRVKLMEQRPQCDERVCGSFLDPEGVEHLQWLGALPEALNAGAIAVHKIVLTSRSGRGEISLEDHPGLAFPRPNLERLLLRKAEESGAEVTMGARVKNLRQESGGWIAETNKLGEQRADMAVLADGRFTSAVAISKSPGGGWFGWNARFTDVNQLPGELSLHFFPRGYVGILTFSNGQSNVCGLIHRMPDQTKAWDSVFQTALAEQQFLAQCMNNARRLTDWRGVGPLPFCLRMRKSPGPILAGDAAAVGDPFMGEGIGRALASGRLIDAALKGPGMERSYNRLWKQRFSRRLWLGSIVRCVLSHPVLAESLFGLIRRRSTSLSSVLSIFDAGLAPWSAHPQ